MKQLILINGKKRHGKDYTAELLAKNHDVEVLSFAEPMKQIIATIFGITLEELDEYKNKPEEYGIECVGYSNNQPHTLFAQTDFREVLQKFGSEAMKPIFGNDVWVQAIKRKIDESTAQYVVIADFRFVVELLGLLNYSPYVISVVNNEIPSTDMHSSEAELDEAGVKFDITLDNTGQPSDFEETVISAFDELMIKAPLYNTDEGRIEIEKLLKF